MIRVAAFAIVLLATSPSIAAGQPPVLVVRPEGSVARVVEWLDAVLAHTPGAEDAALDRVAGFSSEVVRHLQVEIAAILRLIRNPQTNAFFLPVDFDRRGGTEIRYTGSDRTVLKDAAERVARTGWNDADLAARGVLLHTDVAVLGNGAGRILQFSDGQRVGFNTEPVDHWRAARILADMIDKRDGRLADLTVWSRASLARLIAIAHWNAAHTEHAVDRFGIDADVRFRAGCLHEMLASPRTQAFITGGGVPVGFEPRVGSRNDELDRAAGLFKRALELDPRHTEARIHYGRVLTLLGRATTAVPELRRAAGEAKETEQRYFAQLFLGAAFEGSGQTSAARAAYESAASLFPRAQAPRLALSHLAFTTGQRGDARTAIDPLLTPRADEAEREDPWWFYLSSAGRDADQILADARRRLATPRAKP